MRANDQATDIHLKMGVLAEMKFDPAVTTTDICVMVKNGVVTLIGFAADYGEKLSAVSATKRVAGVLAIADEIEVNMPVFGFRSDSDIAEAASTRINGSMLIPAGAVTLTVHEGRITLRGALDWGYERNAAEKAVQHLAGVKEITNLIRIKPTLDPVDIKSNLTSALKRNAILDYGAIQVETVGSSVVLSGKVHNHSELEEAVRTAWNAPGVHTVDNQLKVDRFWALAV